MEKVWQYSHRKKKARFTPKICSIAELNLLTTTWDDGDGAVLDKVHFPTQRSLSYNKISRLEDFETQLGQDHRHKMRVSVGKQWHIGYESTTVIADNLLHEGEKQEVVIKYLCQVLTTVTFMKDLVDLKHL